MKLSGNSSSLVVRSGDLSNLIYVVFGEVGLQVVSQIVNKELCCFSNIVFAKLISINGDLSNLCSLNYFHR